MPIIEKLQRLLLTKKEIYAAIRSKGIDISDNAPFSDVIEIISEDMQAVPGIWSIAADGKSAQLIVFPSTLRTASSDSSDIVIKNSATFSVPRFDTGGSYKLVSDGTTRNPSYSDSAYRNSIISFYASGSNIYLITNSNYYSFRDRSYLNTLGYFLTGENGELKGWVKKYDSKYDFKCGVPENFISYDPSSETMLLKAGDYDGDPTKTKAEATIPVESDVVLYPQHFGSGQLNWMSDDYMYSIGIMAPQSSLYVMYNGLQPSVEDYVRSTQIKTTGAPNKIMARESSTNYQWFTNTYTELRDDLKYGLEFRKSASSSSFAFDNVGDEFMIKLVVGDGFRNYVSDDYDYDWLAFFSIPYSMDVRLELHFLDGSERILTTSDESSLISTSELKRLDWFEWIYTVTNTSSGSYREIESELAMGFYNKPFSESITLSTSYQQIMFSMGGSSTGYYFNMGPGRVLEDITTVPRYEVPW